MDRKKFDAIVRELFAESFEKAPDIKKLRGAKRSQQEYLRDHGIDEGDRYTVWNGGANPKDDKGLQMKWTIGGMAGGDWTGAEARPFRSEEGEPKKFDALHKLLERVCPSISVFAYFDLIEKVVEYRTETDREYYGNYTEYGVKRVEFDKLYDYLAEQELI